MANTSVTWKFGAAVFIAAIAFSCVDKQPVGLNPPDAASGRAVPTDANRAAGSNTFFTGNTFFTAWSMSYRTSPIQTQSISGPDSRQYRQYTGFTAEANVLAFASANPGKLYINGDEPDQGCISPYDYAGIYHDWAAAIRGADPTARLSPAGVADPNDQCCPIPSGACRNTMHYTGYMEQFYNSYVQRYGVAPPVDEWRFHNFAQWLGVGDITTWWSQVSDAAGWSLNHGANMVLGSWGFLGWNEPWSAYQAHMQQAMDLLRGDPRINEAVWWSYENISGHPHYLLNADGTLTPEGQQYASYAPPLSSVSISGPTLIRPGATCTWWAIVGDGTAPYSYQWTNDGMPAGSNSDEYTGRKDPGNTGSSFRIGVTVTDARGRQVNNEITVTESSSARICFQ
jgi:hypothetical protein